MSLEVNIFINILNSNSPNCQGYFNEKVVSCFTEIKYFLKA